MFQHRLTGCWQFDHSDKVGALRHQVGASGYLQQSNGAERHPNAGRCLALGWLVRFDYFDDGSTSATIFWT